MRIAFISYEFPPHSSLGGIATYVSQMAGLLTDAGCEVEVFCGSDSPPPYSETEHNCLLVHRLPCRRAEFPRLAADRFAARQDLSPFDVLEGPDYLAEALPAAQLRPGVPFVVRLHTPWRVIADINAPRRPCHRAVEQLRYAWYCLRTRRRPAFLPPDPVFASEAANARRAVLVLAPSRAVADRVRRLWHLDPEKIEDAPLPFTPSPDLLSIPPGGCFGRVTFVGRLEWRKGVQDFAAAIPSILGEFPETKFRFVGADGLHPARQEPMSAFIRRAAGPKAASQLEFTGSVPPPALPALLRDTDVCVVPSRWESFGYVLLEAMAAARACVCTSGSGPAEIAGQGKFAAIVPPASPARLAAAVRRLLADPEARLQLGALAREKALLPYRPEAVLARQLDCYHRAVALHPIAAPKS